MIEPSIVTVSLLCLLYHFHQYVLLFSGLCFTPQQITRAGWINLFLKNFCF